MSRGNAFNYDLIRAMVKTKSKDAVARELGCSLATVARAAGNVGRAGRGQEHRIRATSSRHANEPLVGKRAVMPAFDNPSIMAGRTVYPSTVTPAAEAKNVLKSGFNSSKIGGVIRKGRWSGMPVYTLTLEERATCPKSCAHWRSCYGNLMHFAERLEHGHDLTNRLEQELAVLSSNYPGGFVIRLHALGDFYSTAYVAFWERMLARHPALRVFGYTARIDGINDPISGALVRLVMAQWERFAIRFSNAPVDECSTISIEHPYQKPADAVICPAQTGGTESCSTCGLCWGTAKRIAFLQH